MNQTSGGQPRFLGALRTWDLAAALAGVVIFLGFAACTDDPMDPPVVDVAEVLVTPDSVTFDRLGATLSATASARAADGSTLSKRINWASSDQGVVRLVTSGSLNQNAQLVATGNGTATVRATADGVAGGVTVRVEQDIDGLRFLTDPRDALVGGSSGDVEIAVVDAAGEPVASATGIVTLDMAPGAPGALQGGPRTATLQQGVASFADIRAAGAGSGYELLATWDPLSTTSVPFDIVSDFDRLVVVGADPGSVAATIDGQRSAGPFDDEGVLFSDSATSIGVIRGPSSGARMAVYAPGRRTSHTTASFTPGVDTVRVTLEEPIRLDATIWIVRGPFASQSARALDAVAMTRTIWRDEVVGIELDSVEVVDATADPEAAGLARLTLCNSKAALESDIGKRDGRINIYYVETVDGGTDRGRARPIGGDHIIMAERSGNELLSHEIGHLLSLTHTDAITADFDRTNVMHSASSQRRYLTEAQIFRQQFNPNSAINSIFGLRSNETVLCGRDVVSPACPAIELRLRPDGGFPANFVALENGDRPGPVLAEAGAGSAGTLGDIASLGIDDVVRRWTELSCEMDENEGLGHRLRAGGDRGGGGVGRTRAGSRRCHAGAAKAFRFGRVGADWR